MFDENTKGTMKAGIEYKGKTYKADFSKPLDISIALRPGTENVNAFYLPPVTIEAFRAGGFTGSVLAGGPCNVNNIFFNPHGNGTHTESLGHITRELYAVNDCLKNFFFFAELITVSPQREGEDLIIMKDQIVDNLGDKAPQALIIRTLPNDKSKMNRQYSGTNPPYLHHEAAKYISVSGIQHLLLDLPSVDREEDQGKLLAHHAFWNYPDSPRINSTITELIFVDDHIRDGLYLLNLQIASFENDASPSKPVLYHLEE